MRILAIFAIVVSMVTPLLAQNEAQAITDPQQITSRGKPDVQKLALDKLFMSYLVGGTAWSPDRKGIPFIGDVRGPKHLWLGAGAGGSPVEITVSDQLPGTPA